VQYLLNRRVVVGVVLFVGGCNSAPIIPTSQPLPPSTSTTLPTAKPADMSTSFLVSADRPLVWFGPMPPTLPTGAGRPFIGSEDYMDLFAPDSPWSDASERVHVFLLYGEWVGCNYATNDELVQIIEDLNRRGIALAIEGSLLERSDDCGTGIESWGGIPEGLRIAQRIIDAGGKIHFWAMDAPFKYANLLDEPGACQWSAETVAQAIANFVDALRSIFPEIVVGDTEPLRTDRDNVEVYGRWMQIYREVAGENLPFIHLDVDYGQSDWAEEAKAVEELARQEGIDFGIFYGGDRGDPSDKAWLTSAGERVKTYEDVSGGEPDHIMFQSWQDHPDYVLPESEPYTFANFIDLYFDNRAALGVPTRGPGANLAYDKSVSASGSLMEFPPANAVDGIYSSWWGAGDFAPQWFEIDLHAPVSVAQIRLAISQDPDGDTFHRIWGREVGEDYLLLHEFRGFTSGDDVLEFIPLVPWENIQFIKIETLESPSWVSWREIEILSPEE